MKNEVYRCVLRLEDYLFFATTERGKVYETGAFIHNYALAYALRLASGTYTNQIQKPNYQAELAELNQHAVYITPARLHSAPNFRLHQFNTIKEGYGFGKKDRSIGYPDWGYVRQIPPETEFVFYVLWQEMAQQPISPEDHLWTRFRSQLEHGCLYVRLGKFMSKALIAVQRAVEVNVKAQGAFVANALLNWRDLHAEPIFFDLIGDALPTRLMSNVRFNEGSHVTATFADTQKVVLPTAMSFLHRLS